MYVLDRRGIIRSLDVRGDDLANLVGELVKEALVAAVHRFAEEGELTHLRAVLDRQPKLVKLKQTFPGGRKPSWTDTYTLLHRAAARGRRTWSRICSKRGRT